MNPSKLHSGHRRSFYLFLLLSAGAALLLVGMLHDRTLPFAEGWYTYYARCINEGALPYRNFEYLYPPVYIYTVAFFTRVFGYELIVLRRLGVLFFLLITVGLYLVGVEVVGKRRCAVAAVAAVCGAFYLQSEVVQTFYDYVRFMDIFSIFSLYFLLKAAKALVKGRPCRRDLLTCGVLLGVLLNIKQNTGLIFTAFALILLIYLCIWAKKPKTVLLFDLLWLLIPLVGFCLSVIAALAATGSLTGYFMMTGGAAAGAKGGLFAILFGWLINNGGAFLSALPAALLFLFLLIGGYWLPKSPSPPKNEQGLLAGILFFLPLLLLLIIALCSDTAGKALAPRYYLSTYTVFLTVTPLFAVLGVLGIVDMAKNTQKLAPYLPFFVVSGAYVALSFACGNSGGLAEGQAPFGILFLILSATTLAERVFFGAQKAADACTVTVRGGVLLLALLLALHSADKKLVFPYNWWGMNESSFWECTEPIGLPRAEGIAVSPATAAVYRDIVNTVTRHVPPGEPIFCFPQIPIFYVLTDRPDPGIFTKVQWFDVASDEAIRADIEVLLKNPPRAILIYHTSEYAYTSHEQAFRGGGVSGTRQMRDFLTAFVAKEGYRLHQTYKTMDNTLSLWLAT